MAHDHSAATPAAADPAALARVEAGLRMACATQPALRPGARLMLACSAGGDSMALLHLFAEAAAQTPPGRESPRGWQLAVTHFDHRQRPESAAEAAFVAEQACALGLPCFIAHTPEALLAGSPLNEATMRELRHAAWARFAAWWEADALVLAHHLDDQAETLLMRLLEASGPGGLGAMRPEQELQVGGPPGAMGIMTLRIVRPLLALRRADLRAWLQARGLAWHEDPSNLDCTRPRAWVRHELLPLLDARLGHEAAPPLARSAELIRDEAAALQQAVEILLGQLVEPAAAPARERFLLRHPCWQTAGAVLRRQLLRAWLIRLRAAPHPPGFPVMQEALAFAERGRPGSDLRTVGRWHLRRTREALVAFGPEVDIAQRSAWSDGDAATE